MIKKKIIDRAKKTLSTEIKEIQNLSKIFNDMIENGFHEHKNIRVIFKK